MTVGADVSRRALRDLTAQQRDQLITLLGQVAEAMDRPDPPHTASPTVRAG